MKESNQTLCFLGAAAATVLLAIFTQPSDATFDIAQLAGTMINPAFNAEEAKSLSIVRFNEESATLRQFEVSEEEGVWSIPSKDDYPADADQQMARASTAVMDREILRVASESASSHVEYGVITPSNELDIDAIGVGTRVTISDEKGDNLVDLVIGKEVKDQPSQRYVRRVSQDAVYVANIALENLSTNFADWIEDDLLKIDPLDIASIQIKDYTAELIPQGRSIGIALVPKADMTVVFNDEASIWVPGDLKAYDKTSKEYTPFELAADKQLNADALDALKTALGDLLIVDVEKKPTSLSDALKQGTDFSSDQESAMNLIRHGFAPTKDADGKPIIYSTEGEAVCTLKEGIEYVLRFGNLQIHSDEDAIASADGESAQDSVNRYLFVMARFNESALTPPALEELPELPAETDDADEDDEDKDDADEDDVSDDEEASEEDGTIDNLSEEERKELLADRELVERRNTQLLDAYEDRIEAAKQRVQELNARFGDWYYVIPNDVYQKIRLSRDDVITERVSDAKEEAATDPNASQFGAPGSAIPGLPAIPQP